MKIVAAVVTHNRERLLERCVDHLLTQTRPPDEIVVINNGSSDGTLKMLERKQVRVVTQDNVGSAGGWCRAIDEADAAGADAVWLMDDDGFPDAGALKILEANSTSDTACLSSVVVNEIDHDQLVFPMPVLDESDLPILYATRRKIHRLSELRAAGKTSYPFAHLFNGALVSLAVVRKIGNVDERFFLMGDEVDFLMRMRPAGVVASCLDALHYHPNVSARPWSDIKVYYYVKNTIILNSRYFGSRPIRHVAAVAAALARVARRNSLREGLSYIAGSKAAVLRRAISRGLRGQIGKDHHFD